MIAAYIRISSHSQKKTSQKNEIQRWLKAYGYHPNTVTWFEDQDSGTTLQRQAFQQMQHAIFQGNVKTVVVWK